MIVSSMVRFAVSGPVAALVTLALFQLMHVLISRPVSLPAPETARVLVSITPQEDAPKPEASDPFHTPVLVPPPLPEPIVTTVDAKSDLPNIVLDLPTGGTKFKLPTTIDGGSAILNRAVQLITEPIPTYPARALAAGREGVCDVSLDVDPQGNPFNLSAECSHPVFQDEALRAAKGVRFIPEIDSGKAVVRRGIVIPIEFALED
ncbi:MAG: TonB family protein [Pseudomonadota bacterium]